MKKLEGWVIGSPGPSGTCLARRQGSATRFRHPRTHLLRAHPRAPGCVFWLLLPSPPCTRFLSRTGLVLNAWGGAGEAGPVGLGWAAFQGRRQEGGYQARGCIVRGEAWWPRPLFESPGKFWSLRGHCGFSLSPTSVFCDPGSGCLSSLPFHPRGLGPCWPQVRGRGCPRSLRKFLC